MDIPSFEILFILQDTATIRMHLNDQNVLLVFTFDNWNLPLGFSFISADWNGKISPLIIIEKVKCMT